MTSDTKWTFPRAEALPPYAFVSTDAVKAEVRASGAEIIDLGLGNPDRPTPEPILAQLHAAADVGANHRYHPGRGLPALREALVGWYQRRYDTTLDFEQETIVTMGAKEGISHLCMAILDRGDMVLVPDPCYPIHHAAPRIANADVTPYPVGPGKSPAGEIKTALDALAKQGVTPKLVIANYPHNPTGQVVSKEELRQVVEVIRDAGSLLLHDLAYADLDFRTRYAPSIFDCGLPADEVKSFAVEIFSMSKSYHMPGWRIAYMVGNRRLVGALAHMKTYLDYGTFRPLQHAAAWALEHGDSIVDEARELYRGRATALTEGLRKAGWGDVADPSGSMFVWTPLPKAWTSLTSREAAVKLIREAHVAAAPGSGFGPGGEGWLRFALIEDPPRVAEACERIARAL